MNKTDSLLLIGIFIVTFALIIWQLIRYSDNTVGKYSPLKISRTYQIHYFRYFTKLDNLFLYWVGISGLYFLSKVPDTFSSSVYLYDWRNPASLICFSLLLISLSASYLYLDINYWQHTKNIRVSYLPEEKIVMICFPDKTYTLGQGDIIGIELITNGAKMQLGYYVYFLANGESFILTDRMPGVWAIQEYFRKIPFKMSIKRFPVIK